MPGPLPAARAWSGAPTSRSEPRDCSALGSPPCPCPSPAVLGPPLPLGTPGAGFYKRGWRWEQGPPTRPPAAQPRHQGGSGVLLRNPKAHPESHQIPGCVLTNPSWLHPPPRRGPGPQWGTGWMSTPGGLWVQGPRAPVRPLSAAVAQTPEWEAEPTGQGPGYRANATCAHGRCQPPGTKPGSGSGSRTGPLATMTVTLGQCTRNQKQGPSPGSARQSGGRGWGDLSARAPPGPRPGWREPPPAWAVGRGGSCRESTSPFSPSPRSPACAVPSSLS